MHINSMYTQIPNQPNNPSDSERHYLARIAFNMAGRPEDFEYVRRLTAPPADITTIARPGEFKGKRVGIIGGGAAGLAAAFELRKLGFDITIFEAQENRVGGRIYTYYFDEAKTLYGEMGAMRFPVTHETTWHYINLFGLNTRTFIQSNNNGYIYFRDARARYTADGTSIKKNIYPKYKLTEWERNTAWQKLIYLGFDSHLLKAYPEMRTEILQVKSRYNPYTLYWDSQNNRQMLEKTGLSSDAISLISNFSPLAGNLLYNSYIDYVQELYSVDLTYLYEIVGGLANLPLAFYNSFIDENYKKYYPHISSERLGRVKWKGGNWVTGISKAENNKVKLFYRNKTVNDKLYEEFEYVICAIPFSTLRNVEIDPLFTPAKMQAIKEVDYINALKSAVLCNRRFWEEGASDRRIIGGPSYTDLPLTSIWYPSDHIKFINTSNKAFAGQPGVLIIYNFNLDSTRLGNLPKHMQFDEIKREIEEIHGLPDKYLEQIAENFKTVNWNTEPWFRGALCFFTPEQKRLFSYPMSLPEYGGRIFFAGEHISAKHRWVQGALKSGMEAANNLAAACRCQQS